MIKYFCDGCNKEMFFHLEKNSPDTHQKKHSRNRIKYKL